MKKTYLGDSVYVELVSGMFKLTTENGMGQIKKEAWYY
jgi:hypothetical protein